MKKVHLSVRRGSFLFRVVCFRGVYFVNVLPFTSGSFLSWRFGSLSSALSFASFLIKKHKSIIIKEV
jgi:hypothetical protein